MKKTLSLIVVILVLNFAIAPNILAKNKETEFVERMRTEISKLGVGQDAKVKLKLKSGAKIKGYISEIGENQFAITDAKTGQITQVSYSNVKQVKGNNLSTGVKIAIGVAVFLVLLVIIGSQLK